jgi:hypothetical protein
MFEDVVVNCQESKSGDTPTSGDGSLAARAVGDNRPIPILVRRI